MTSAPKIPTDTPRAAQINIVHDVRTSTELDELLAALSDVQSQLSTIAATETADAGRYSYTYANLATLLRAANPLLAKHGLCLSQWPTGQHLVNWLGHKSGQWMASAYPIIVAPLRGRDGVDPQAYGSALTYARRYCAFAILGVAPAEDDDGRAANNQSRERPVSRPAQERTTTPAPAAAPAAPAPPATVRESTGPPLPAVNQDWFGSDQQGRWDGWIARVATIKTGEKNGTPWSLYGIRTCYGEEFKSFNHDVANMCSDSVATGIGVILEWQRQAPRDPKYGDSFNVASGSPFNDTMAKLGNVTSITVNVTKFSTNKLTTDRGIFFVPEEFHADAGGWVGQEKRFIVRSTPKYRQIEELLNAGEQPAGTATEPGAPAGPSDPDGLPEFGPTPQRSDPVPPGGEGVSEDGGGAPDRVNAATQDADIPY